MPERIPFRLRDLTKILLVPFVLLGMTPAAIVHGTEKTTLAMEYGMMGWQAGLRSPEFRIETSQFVLAYEHNLFGPKAVSILKKAPRQEDALFQFEEPRHPLRLLCLLSREGNVSPMESARKDFRNSMIVESGRFFQRRWQPGKFSGEVGWDEENSGLETSAWPDRLAFVFRTSPTQAVHKASLACTLHFPEFAGGVSPCQESWLFEMSDGSAFLLGAIGRDVRLAWNAESKTITAATPPEDWEPGQRIAAGVTLIPLPGRSAAQAEHMREREHSPFHISARCLEPGEKELPVQHNSETGWYHVAVPAGGKGDDGLMRARIQIHNPANFSNRLRLCFDGVPFNIPGITAVLCDAQGIPTGIPIQYSKNWHTQANRTGGFAGYWFHGLTMLDLAAGETREMMLMMAGENWGGLPAASHSQLSVIGYGGNQQWDEAALGCRGEALCYDLDHVLTANHFTDSRPFGVLDPKGQRNWGINVGGGSILRYTDAGGVRQPQDRMRMAYHRYGPNRTEVVLGGYSADQAVRYSCSLGLYRADDCTRGVHRLRVDILRDIEPRRFVLYQQAGETYCYNQGDQLALGDAAHALPLRQWAASGTPGTPTGEPIAMPGPSPWAAVINGKAEKGYLPANHGVILRSWKARWGGEAAPWPLLQEYRNGQGVSLLEWIAPPGVHLKKGDFAEMDFVRVILPRSANAYGGKNESFRRALGEYDNDARMILREAVGNQIAVQMEMGKLRSLYPLVIEAEQDQAVFILEGGLDSIPVTFTRLTRNGRPILEQKKEGVWRPIDPLLPDRPDWQCDLHPDGFEITTDLRRDTPVAPFEQMIVAPPKREFRFRFE